MIYFNCDYSEGAHPKVLQKLIDTNMEQTPGYGDDIYCEKARELIRKECECETADVHFLVGGTQANATVIDATLRIHQGVISVQTGHINVHESGAIEATGHKVLVVESGDGKITAEQIQTVYDLHFGDVTFEHMVQPKTVYISHPTELGTVYTKEELTKISETCRKCGFYLFMDGARLGYGLSSEGNDLSLADIAKLCDVFYIGGTKVGTLFGEAVVITNDKLKEDFRYIIKQHGGRFAKGRLLGLQFIALFEDGLYKEMSDHAIKMAVMIKNALLDKGFVPYVNSPTNQQFFIIPDDILDKLGKKYVYSPSGRYNESSSIARFCTSWATKEEDVLEFVADIKKL